MEALVQKFGLNNVLGGISLSFVLLMGISLMIVSAWLQGRKERKTEKMSRASGQPIATK